VPTSAERRKRGKSPRKPPTRHPTQPLEGDAEPAAPAPAPANLERRALPVAAAAEMAANLEDVPSLDLMHELLRRMKCSSKPDKRLILIGTGDPPPFPFFLLVNGVRWIPDTVPGAVGTEKSRLTPLVLRIR